MKWNILPETLPKEGDSVILKIHVTSIGDIIDKEDIVAAEYRDGKWYIDGSELIGNDYPIFRTPIAWSEN
jgi:hypothetical protein